MGWSLWRWRLFSRWQFCIFQGLDEEARSSFAQAIAGVRAQMAREPAANAKEAAGHLFRQRLLAKLLAIHTDLLFAQGQDGVMMAQAQEAIQLGAASGGVEGEALGTFVLGRVAQEAEQRRQAGELWRRAIQLVQTYQPAHAESEVLHEVHWMAHHWLRGNALSFGDYAGARAYIMQALRICQTCCDVQVNVKQHARAYIMQALRICQTLGKRRGELFCLGGVAELNFLLFDTAAAAVDLAAMLDLARTLNYRRVEMYTQERLAEIVQQRGDYNLVTAQTQVEAILPVLAVQPHAGYNNPFFIYLTCHRVLAANDDPRAATILQQGYGTCSTRTPPR